MTASGWATEVTKKTELLAKQVLQYESDLLDLQKGQRIKLTQ